MGWALQVEGALAPSALFKTQSAAWEKAKAVARKERSEALLHGKDGQIRERSTYATNARKR
jgi:hypothetical protein